MKRGPWVLIAAAVLGLWGLGAALQAEPAPDPLDIAKSIMSPVCPGRLIADCPSPEAEQLREVIRRQVAQGKSKQEIVDYFVEVYGQSVLPAPPQRGFFLTAWYLPLALMLSGGGIIFVLVRIWARGEKGEETPPERKRAASDDPAIQRYARILDEELKQFDQ
ncbi:MAG: cytochrome c-type biogenesis protein CcmH [Nitrospinota bacterium]